MGDFANKLVAAAKPELDKAQEYQKPIIDALKEIIEALALATGGLWRFSAKLVWRNDRLCYPIESYRPKKRSWKMVMKEDVCYLCAVHVPLNGWPATVYMYDWRRVAHNKDELFDAMLEVIKTDEGQETLAISSSMWLWIESKPNEVTE
jgi:hypothetical protein